MKLTLNTNFMAFNLGNDKYLIGSTLERQFEIEMDEPTKQLLSHFGQPLSRENAAELMTGSLSKEEVYELVDWAVEQGILIQDFDEQTARQEDYNPRYDRQIRLFEGINPGQGFATQQKLSNSRVVLLGAGGTGSYILFTLAAMGVGFVRVVDFHRVKVSNLSRQILYTEQDIGKLKVDCAKERIRQLNPELDYEYIDYQLANEDDIEKLIAGFDFCILSVDTPRKKIKTMVNNVCVKLNIPYIYGGSNFDSIVVGPLVIPGQTKNLNDMAKSMNKEEDNFTEAFNQGFVSTLIDPYNALAASFTALECVKYLTNFSEPTLKNKVMVINLANYETTLAQI